MDEIAQGLVNVFLDTEASLADRDDAAMDLGAFPENEVLQALIKVASSLGESEILKASCGESISQIWQAQGKADLTAFASLMPAARAEIDSRISIA
jgi:predicted secreted protein